MATYSVRNLIGLFGPCAESGECLVAHDLNHGDAALSVRLFEFAVNKGVVETNFGSVFGGVCEINARKASPVNGAKTHGTGFAGGVDFTILEFEIAQFLAGLADGQHFGVRGGIICGSDAIGSFGNDLMVFYNDGRKRATASGLNAFDGELNRTGHKRIDHVVLAVRPKVQPFRARDKAGAVYEREFTRQVPEQRSKYKARKPRSRTFFALNYRF